MPKFTTDAAYEKVCKDLLRAVSENNPDELRLALRRSKGVVMDTVYSTMMKRACALGHVECMKILAPKADLSKANLTYLFEAVDHDQYGALRFLMENGPVPPGGGRLPKIAAAMGHERIVDALLPITTPKTRFQIVESVLMVCSKLRGEDRSLLGKYHRIVLDTLLQGGVRRIIEKTLAHTEFDLASSLDALLPGFFQTHPKLVPSTWPTDMDRMPQTLAYLQGQHLDLKTPQRKSIATRRL